MDRPTRSSSETDDESPDLERLRGEIELVNDELLVLLNRRARLVTEVQRVKTREGIPTFIPQREQQQLDDLVTRNKGPFDDGTISHLFKEIFKASVELMERRKEHALKVSRAAHGRDLQIDVGAASIGAPDAPMLIAGPCAVEDAAQMEATASHLAALGLRFIRGGAFKPRSSPYSFQGLGREGLELLEQAAERHGLVSVTEVMDTRSVELVCNHADILQIGSRNMYNYDLLREVGRCHKPVLLKRAFSATIDELLWSAEYIVNQGNERVILCERGIRTYERQTRNTLDISAVPLLRQKSYLPVIVDVSHAAGRKDILAPLGRAALAAGASGLMVEAHPCPALARSDSQQQLDLDELTRFIREVGLPVEANVPLVSAAASAALTRAAPL